MKCRPHGEAWGKIEDVVEKERCHSADAGEIREIEASSAQPKRRTTIQSTLDADALLYTHHTCSLHAPRARSSSLR